MGETGVDPANRFAGIRVHQFHFPRFLANEDAPARRQEAQALICPPALHIEISLEAAQDFTALQVDQLDARIRCPHGKAIRFSAIREFDTFEAPPLRLGLR
jgi:hypothetical protein